MVEVYALSRGSHSETSDPRQAALQPRIPQGVPSSTVSAI